MECEVIILVVLRVVTHHGTLTEGETGGFTHVVVRGGSGDGGILGDFGDLDGLSVNRGSTIQAHLGNAVVLDGILRSVQDNRREV